MDMLDQTYHIMLANRLRGRRVIDGANQLRFFGSDANIPYGDIHRDRFYQVYFDLDGDLSITATAVAVTGDLISPCSGYAQESVDELDYPYVLNYCMKHTL